VADAIWLQLRLKRLGRNTIGMNTNEQDSDGATRVAYILGVPLAENVVRQWPQMGEIARTYSPSPAASRACARSRNISALTISAPRNVETCHQCPSTAAALPGGRPL
jgi:hypothetical protein